MHMSAMKLCSQTWLILWLIVADFLPGMSDMGNVSLSQAETVRLGQDTLDWPRPRFDERKDDRWKMVRYGIKANGVTDVKTLDAMRHVPRHKFIPESLQALAYQNRPLPIGYGQTISQPYIVGYMTQLLDLEAGEKVLDIGTGSGYQAAVLSEVTPHVYTIEIVEELAKKTRKLLKKLGYTSIKTKIGDGYQGWEKHAPYDAIILTAAASEVPDPLVQQLKTGGVMVMPVGEPGETQALVKITKNEEGDIKREQLLPVRFVPMTGKVRKNN